MNLHRVALILAIMGVACEVSWASTQCKMVVMDVHMKRCRSGARTKRAMERFDLQKYDDKSKRQEGPDRSKVDDDPAFRAVPQKRHLPVEVGHIALPIVTEALNGAAKAQGYSSSRTGYYGAAPSLVGRVFDQPGYRTPISHAFDGGVAPFFSPAFNDDFGLDLNTEELNELYNDIYERLPRASKEEAWKIFLDTASKCCQNIDKCLKGATHIPCLTF